MNDKISIIIPIYNIENLLDQMIKSIIFQTYKNLEIILVNDGSTDGSEHVCKSWMNQDSRIKYFFQENKGVSDARNLGFKKSTGDFILFLDGDDEIAPDMCEKMISQIIAEKSDFCYCGFENIFDDSEVKLVPSHKTLENNEIICALIHDETFFTAIWNKMFKRTMLLDKNGEFISFQEGIHVGEDFLWLSKILKNATKAAVVPETLYYWKRRANSATQGGSEVRTDKRYLSILDAYRGIVMEISDQNLKRSICKKFLGLSRDCLVNAYRKKEIELTNYLYKKISDDKALYDKYDLFYLKLNICCYFVKLKMPIRMIEKIRKL